MSILCKAKAMRASDSTVSGLAVMKSEIGRIAHRRGVGIEPVQGIALAENAHQLVAIGNHHAADRMADEHVEHFVDRRVRRRP